MQARAHIFASARADRRRRQASPPLNVAAVAAAELRQLTRVDVCSKNSLTIIGTFDRGSRLE